MYEKGQGVPQDNKTAVKWYTLAADQGIAVAQTNLGYRYEKGLGVPQDYETALKWYRLAAEQGNAFAQYGLGTMYYLGLGVPQDYKTAVKWYRLAAEQGFAVAQTNLERLEEKIAEQTSSPQSLPKNQNLKSGKRWTTWFSRTVFTTRSSPTFRSQVR
jgi:TPR repeat protein